VGIQGFGIFNYLRVLLGRMWDRKVELLKGDLYTGNYEDYEFEEFNNIIKTANIQTLFQPIISLTDGTVIGYEALSRGPQNSYMQNP